MIILLLGIIAFYVNNSVHNPLMRPCQTSAGCAGRGSTICPTCNADQEPGYYKENQMIPCSACYGRGLIAHRDGSDTM